MAFDKNKITRSAEKYLAQGKLPAAIKEYKQIVANDPQDFTALNMLGDLYVRTGDQKGAVNCFAHIADHYREQGFTLKAIAMYKKIDRLQPNDMQIANQLAALYEIMGLIVEARAQYLIVADSYTRAGQVTKALEVLHKIADLEPTNTEIRLKLAQGYLRESMRPQAVDAYLHAGLQFISRGAHQKALEALGQARDIDPRREDILKGLLAAHVALGTASEAAVILEQALREQPNDVNLLAMLAQAYVAADNASEAERVTVALVEREEANYPRFVDVARLYLNRNELDAAVKMLATVIEPMLAAHGDAQIMDLLDETLARDANHLEALRLLVRIHTWRHDDANLQFALEHLAQAAAAAKLTDEERDAFARLVQLAPERADYLERLQELGGAPAVSENIFSSGKVLESGEVPTFESFILMDEPIGMAPAAKPKSPAEEVVEFEWNSVADPSASFADLNDELNGVTTTTKPAAPASNSSQEFDLTLEDHGRLSGGSAKSSAAPADTARNADLERELESVDFYLAQGYTDIAVDTLNMLERQFGAHPEISRRRTVADQSAHATDSIAAVPVEETIELTDFTHYDAAEEASVNGKAVEATQPSAIGKNGGARDTAPVASSTAKGLDAGLAEIFDEFRNAVEHQETSAANGDYETHYNLGLAYKDMDLADEAIEEFQLAAKLVAPNDGTARYLQCCNLIGHCFMRKDKSRLAAMWFKKGLEAPGHSEDEYQALRYELGNAYEQMGDIDRAIDVFTEIYGINISYRGVAEKLQELEAQRVMK